MSFEVSNENPNKIQQQSEFIRSGEQVGVYLKTGNNPNPRRQGTASPVSFQLWWPTHFGRQFWLLKASRNRKIYKIFAMIIDNLLNIWSTDFVWDFMAGGHRYISRKRWVSPILPCRRKCVGYRTCTDWCVLFIPNWSHRTSDLAPLEPHSRLRQAFNKCWRHWRIWNQQSFSTFGNWFSPPSIRRLERNI